MSDLRTQYEQAREEVQEAEQELQRIASEQEEVEREIRRLESERADAEARAEVDGLRPDRPATATAVKETRALEQKIQDLRIRKQTAERVVQEARARSKELAQDLVKEELAPTLRSARADRVQALHHLGQAAADAYTDVYKALQTEREARLQVSEMLPATDTGSNAERGLREYTEAPVRDVTPEARLGWFIADLIRWTRGLESTVEQVWEQRDIPRINRSVRLFRPLGALEDVLFKMADGNLPS